LSGYNFVSYAKSTYDTSISYKWKSASDVEWPALIQISPMTQQEFDPWTAEGEADLL
jgi:hypothetical protein